ncbi:ferredoxin oxidoreductase [candidate division NPL-UPA2 bacterium Unc8]|uniref:Ferredoxin oxidoreductase n=1 Tax=candidate division NPL-UPA2 bacterium Unc8 TaxID=1980939 RepID=A0A399FW87_UNCN2|nr:Oxalate oxidoreductase subunit beta [Bacillota bacterium]MBT9137576.1 Oxalate oxidoreductase subunit beta [Bacillota bacterium]MBT9146530.1 Oxalate oxidoreductase subunit beta [Bacillota bacterium]RII00431.1 MAG: ferredoxin oxidoreductase [candidate division NPL-UPA2 bacterium Unc8]
MKKNIATISPGFEDIMPEEYQDLVNDGPYGRGLGIKNLGTFKELIEEHPLCAGCGLALAIRLTAASLPAPEDTIIVGTTGCNSILMPQLAIHNIHSLFGNQSSLAAGLKRALKLRYPDKNKDVVVMAGDGGIADIGLSPTLHTWLRRENLTTIMLDNESYSNTGGQESGMSCEGAVLNMAPTGKKFPKIPMPEIAKDSGCAYVATVSVANARRLGRMVKRAILVAREIGPTYLQIFVPCPTNYKFSTSETLKRAKEREKIMEYISSEAEKLIKEANI